MTNSELSIQSQGKLFVLKIAIADLLGLLPSEIDERASLGGFSSLRGNLFPLWEALPQLKDRHIRISSEWTLISLAMEWQKTESVHC